MTAGWPDAATTTWWNLLWQRFWALPVAVATGSLALGLLLPALFTAADRSAGWVFQGGVDGARSLLGTIAGAMISVTGLVFSITMVVLQLASSQFSPRILRSFLESRVVQLTLGSFTGSFLYALTVLRSVRGGEDGRVPQVAVTASYVYVVVAVGMFLAFIHHITTTVQVTHVMADVRRRTIVAARRIAAETGPRRWSPHPGCASASLFNAGRSGYVTSLDSDVLIYVARRLGAVVELHVTPGDHLAAGQLVGRVWNVDELARGAHEQLQKAVGLAVERDIAADAAFGIRQLLDIAERALSPGINDPTTAVQALNELHAVLRELCQLRDPSPHLLHEDDVVAVYRPQTFAHVVDGAVSELAHHARDSQRVLTRLGVVLRELREVARPEHLTAVDAALVRLAAGPKGS